MSRRLLTCSLAGLALTVTALPTVAEAGPRRPDLKVTAVSAPTGVQAGAVLTVTVTTRNAGKATARASTTRVHLSADAKPGGDLAVGTVKVKKLTKGKRRTATVRLVVPAGAAAATYRVLACADAKKKVKESKERNNCRVAKGAVVVTRPVPPPKPPTDPEPDGPYPKAPNPIGVTPELDVARAASASVDPWQPFTLTATGADGTTYTLDLPAQALVGPEQITLTPLADVDGLPLDGGLVAGVELKPHGLVLMKPGTLTIDSPDLGPLDQQTPFYYYGQGEDLHLYPPLPPEAGDDANVVRLPVLHFSTPGVGLGSDASRDAMSDYPPSRLPGQITGDIADLLRGERESQQNGNPPNPDVTQQVLGLLKEFYYAVVKPRLEAAKAAPRNRGAAFSAIDIGYGWLRQMQLLGVGDEEADATPEMQEATALILQVMEAVYKDAWKQCSEEHGLEGLPVLLQLGRMGQIMGFPWAADAIQKYLDCSRFEVRFDSRIDFQGMWPYAGEELHDVPVTGAGGWRAQATGITELTGGVTQLALPLTEWAYQSAYSYERSDGTICSGSSTQTGQVPGTLATFVAPSFPPNRREVPPGEEDTWQEPEVDLLVSARPMGVEDQVRTIGCDGSDYTDTSPSRWQQQYNTFHQGEPTVVTATKADRSADLMYADNWENSSSTPNHLGSENWHETTVLEVWHEPKVGPAP